MILTDWNSCCILYLIDIIMQRSTKRAWVELSPRRSEAAVVNLP